MYIYIQIYIMNRMRLKSMVVHAMLYHSQLGHIFLYDEHMCMSVCLSVCLYACLFVCVSVCLWESVNVSVVSMCVYVGL